MSQEKQHQQPKQEQGHHDHDHGHHDHAQGHHDHGQGHHDHAHGHHDHAHGQGHHDHGHHDHERSLGFGVAETNSGTREPLLRGAGTDQVLYLDAFSGAAGDMIVASLIDLGVPFSVVEEAVAAVAIDGYELAIRHGLCGAIGATKFDVEVAGGQPQRSYADIAKLLDASTLRPSVLDKARVVFARLAAAEADVHRVAVENVHFHEVGAVDSIVDIVGAAACLEYLGAELWVSPLPMGRGFVRCQHGLIPLPAPATLGCLRGLVTCDAGIEGELVTPTGAAILGALAQGSSAWPRMIPVAIGWGAGTRILPDRPNALRAVLGRRAHEGVARPDEAVVLEANIDDATGELIGHVCSVLLQNGALDAWSTPVTMKKGRPGLVLSVLAASQDAERLTTLMLRETTSIGVREYRVSRTIRPRRTIEVETRYGRVSVKVSEGDYGPPQLKPEFADCARLAETTGQPLREIIAEALVAARHVEGQ